MPIIIVDPAKYRTAAEWIAGVTEHTKAGDFVISETDSFFGGHQIIWGHNNDVPRKSNDAK